MSHLMIGWSTETTLMDMFQVRLIYYILGDGQVGKE